MLQEIKAEISTLMLDLDFVRNLSLIALFAILGLYGLSELQSRNIQVNEQVLINRIYRSTSTRIILNR